MLGTGPISLDRGRSYFFVKLAAKFAATRRGGFCILPALMQEVQTLMRVGEPATSARTRWIFGSQRRLVRRWECETFIPKFGFLPQISQTAAMTPYPFQLWGRNKHANRLVLFTCGCRRYHRWL